jgi:hypothetical protein
MILEMVQIITALDSSVYNDILNLSKNFLFTSTTNQSYKNQSLQRIYGNGWNPVLIWKLRLIASHEIEMMNTELRGVENRKFNKKS